MGRAMNIYLTRGAVILFAFSLLLLPGCNWGEGGVDLREDEANRQEVYEPVTITYLGQSAFLIDYGAKILMDPYSPEIGFGKLEMEVDLVTVSHHHFDHNYVEGAQGAVVLYGVDEHGSCNEILHHFAGFNIYTVASCHDGLAGSWLGHNSIFVVETYELRLAHLGDLGHPLGEEETELLGEIDLLLIPVGGHYTLSLEEVMKSIEAVSPAIVVPMHYRTEEFPERMLGTLDEFLSLEIPYPVVQKGKTIELTKNEIPGSTEIWVMDY